MKRIRYQTISAGPDGTFPVGAIRDVPDDVADVLIAGHYASLVDVQPGPRGPAPESTAVRQPEQANLPPAQSNAPAQDPAKPVQGKPPFEAKHVMFGKWRVLDGTGAVMAQDLEKGAAQAQAEAQNAAAPKDGPGTEN